MAVRLITQPAGLGAPLGRYSHVAVAAGELVAVAGQVGLDPEGNLAGPDLAAQARQAYSNLGKALEAVGCGYADIVKMTTYLVDADLIGQFMEVRAEIFADLFPTAEYPPNTLVVANRLVEPEFLFEVEAFAVRQP